MSNIAHEYYTGEVLNVRTVRYLGEGGSVRVRDVLRRVTTGRVRWGC